MHHIDTVVCYDCNTYVREMIFCVGRQWYSQHASIFDDILITTKIAAQKLLWCYCKHPRICNYYSRRFKYLWFNYRPSWNPHRCISECKYSVIFLEMIWFLLSSIILAMKIERLLRIRSIDTCSSNFNCIFWKSLKVKMCEPILNGNGHNKHLQLGLGHFNNNYLFMANLAILSDCILVHPPML